MNFKTLRISGAIALVISLVTSAKALDINSANRAQLEQLNGLGVSTVARVLEERDKRPFTDWNDLSRRVKGFKAKRIEQLRQQGVTVNGQSAPTTQVQP